MAQGVFDEQDETRRENEAADCERKFAVATAGFWFNAARKYQVEGKMREALMAMENAFNHTENALYAERRKGASVAPDQGTPT